MKRIAAFSLAAFTAGCMAQGPVEPSAEARTRLAEELSGRVAGQTVNCVSSRELGGNRSVGQDVILFDGPGSLIYVNRPRGGCPGVNFGRALRIRTSGTRLCEGDLAHVFDPVSGIEHGACSLGGFTPYRRVR
jgi:hypothetical protein